MFFNLFTQKNWIYNSNNISAAYPHINPENIKDVEIWSTCLFVTFLNGSPRFLSKQKVLRAFFDKRENEAKTINTPVWCKTQKMFAIRSKSKNYHTYYTAETQCDCHDYLIQSHIGVTNPTCCHMIKVRNSNKARKDYLERVSQQIPNIVQQLTGMGINIEVVSYKDLTYIIENIVNKNAA